jgi:hypothetical protein
MSDWLDKLKQAAYKTGRAAQRDPRLNRAANNVKEAVDQFKQGYQEQMEPEKHRRRCPHCQADLPENANYCPSCGAKVD